MSELVGHSHDGVEHTHDHTHAHDAEATTVMTQHSHAHADGAGTGEEHTHLHAHTHAEARTATVVEPPPAATDGEKEVAPADRYIIPSDAFEFGADDEEVRYTGTSGLKVTVIEGFEKMARLELVCLRSCLISEMRALSANGATLRKIELYDNQLKSLRGLEACVHLRVLDVSFNALRDMSVVRHCPLLEEVYIAANKLREIEGLEGLAHLKKLDLGANRIRKMRGFQDLVKLEHLFLGKNRIEQIHGLEDLTKLTTLDVQCNRLRSLAGVTSSLEEVYLAHNAIGEDPPLLAADLAPLGHRCTTLDLSHNRVADPAPLAALAKLEDLWMSYNLVPTLKAVEPLGLLPLTTIYLEHNPCADEPSYVSFLRNLLTKLTQVDAQYYPR